ncbi:acetyl-CoA C-acetyltransferase [Klenkia soli]|uniref:Probable acetyl-CoA acetyltransferase n=1 Tax=Klenkia soli TaxID=1052260 RepID=A0A1H0KIQ0_9ACTN|nr:thiolase family protein [Klenkia soli]SDO55828.1 acetyl-CoA C-acetyltransferase [Klenkia soli]
MSGGPVVVAALRSAIGTAGSSFADVPAAELAAPVLAAVAAAVPELPREVVLGNCTGPGGDLARVAALTAGLPVEVPGLTVDRQCASGLAAVVLGAQLLGAEPGLVLAGGVESASTSPRPGRASFAPAELGDPDMGPAADTLARQFGITRAEQDAYAARSHARASAAQQAGVFDAEIVPVRGATRDDRPRPGLTEQRLARLRPAWGGTGTAGNSCGVNDGAAAVALVDAATHARLGVPGLRVLATATAGADPALPGLSLVPAVRLALQRAGLGLADLDVVELNEAFAGQVLACCRALDLEPERVCREGGALALGHPWGASGAVLVVRLFSQLVRAAGGRYGLAAVAAGGGQGVAVVVESVG